MMCSNTVGMSICDMECSATCMRHGACACAGRRIVAADVQKLIDGGGGGGAAPAPTQGAPAPVRLAFLECCVTKLIAMFVVL